MKIGRGKHDSLKVENTEQVSAPQADAAPMVDPLIRKLLSELETLIEYGSVDEKDQVRRVVGITIAVHLDNGRIYPHRVANADPARALGILTWFLTREMEQHDGASWIKQAWNSPETRVRLERGL